MNIQFVLIGVAIIAICVLGFRWGVPRLLFCVLKKSLPPISDTERAAIDAGTLSYEQGIFAGTPDWDHLLQRDLSTLSAAEQDFIDGPVQQVMQLLNDYHVRKNADLPDEVWTLLKDEGFFSFIVPEQYGGLDFSAHALSTIVAMLGAKSVAAGVTVMVPNSLGPAKLLLKFGTEQQKDTYLPKLATGEFVPCFALTGITSGSDAANMRDVGIITKITDNGVEKIGIEAHFSKRYITLAPVATLIGLAIDVYDPDGLLGDYPYVNPATKQVGITVALLERTHQGIEIGNRHMPLGVGFMNGSIRGKNVWIDFDQIIGGKPYLGKGWVMLMACLGVGRAVSMPAVSSAGMEFSTCYTMLYAGMRKQFNLPIAKMEGVIEKLAHSVYLTFVNTSARRLCSTLVDDGENPAVASALIKYASTNDMRTCVNDCMDVLAGKSICDGPNNYVQGVYQAIPVAITVEGANVLTRTLITFSQGAIRAHPYLLQEIESLYDTDSETARDTFAKVIWAHMRFTIKNIFSNVFHNGTRGVFLPKVKNTTAPLVYYRMVNLQAKQFALLADSVLVMLGGRIKAKQMLAGRCADILKNLYYAMAVLKDYETHKNPNMLPLLDYAIRRLCYENRGLMAAVVDNLPFAVVRLKLRLWLFPLSIFNMGLNDKAPTDAAAIKMVRTLYKDMTAMRAVFQNAFDSKIVDEVINDYTVLQRAAPIYNKIKPLLKSGQLLCTYDKNWCDVAFEKSYITADERDTLKQAEHIYYTQMNVDEFSFDTHTHHTDIHTDIAHNMHQR